MTGPSLIVGTGPSELHAHIDLDYRLAALPGHSRARILATTQTEDEWSILADVNTTAGQGQ